MERRHHRRLRPARRLSDPQLGRHRAGGAPPRAPVPRADRCAAATSAVPKVRQITRWLPRRPDALIDNEQGQPGAIRARCAHGRLVGHVTSFAKMMTGRTRRAQPRELVGRGRGQGPARAALRSGRLHADQYAVTNGLTPPYSSVKVEGAVNKMIRRQMHGHANFSLLQQRVIFHPG